MKILIYSKTYIPDLGGLEKNSLILKNSLTEQGHQCFLLTETLDKLDDDLINNIFRSKSPIKMLSLLKNTDLLIVNGGIALKATLPALLLAKKIVIIYQNATLYNQNQNKTITAKLENIFRKTIAKLISINVTLTKDSKQNLKLGNKKSFVLYNPIDPNLIQYIDFDGSLKQKKTYDFCFVGRIIDGKGVFLLTEALLRLKQKNIHPKVAVAGSGIDEHRLKLYCKSNKLDVEFLGRIGGNKIADLYMSSKCLILPSTTHIEGCPLVFAEALFCGTPILCSNQPSMLEAGGKAASGFQSFNINDLAFKMETIIKDEKLLSELIKETLTEKEKFSIDNYKKTLDLIIKSVQK